MTFDTNIPKQLKPKRNRKLPRREILDADFVLPSSSHVIADLLLERAPSQHDRSILSQLWGGNAASFNKNISVSIGKPKRSLRNDRPTKTKTYKDMFQEKHLDEWKMDLSNLTFVPPTAKGKHIRLPDEIKPPVTEHLQESVSELTSENVVNALDEKLQETDTIISHNETQIDCLGVGNHNQLDKGEKSDTDNSINIDNLDETTGALEDNASKIAKIPLEDTAARHVSSENHVQQETSQSPSSDYRMENEDDKLDESSIYDSIPDEDESIVDRDILEEELQQLLIVIDQHSEIDDGSNDSKKAIAQEPQIAETSTNSSSEIVQDQQLVPEACMDDGEEDWHSTKLKHLKNRPMNLMPPMQFSTISEEVKLVELANSIPLFNTTHDKDDKEEDQEMMDDQDEQLAQPKSIKLPTSRHFVVSQTRNSWMISKKNVQDGRPLLNLDSPVYEAPEYTKENLKIIEKWQYNKKKHRILNALKGTTALNWKENALDDSQKKDLGFVRKRQLEQKFSQPFVIRKRIKSCWIVED